MHTRTGIHTKYVRVYVILHVHASRGTGGWLILHCDLGKYVFVNRELENESHAHY